MEPPKPWKSDESDWELGNAESIKQSYNPTRPEHHIRDDTLEITNLHPKTTLKMLMEKITIAGPFGRVYSAHLEKTYPNPTFGQGAGEPVLKAYVAMYTKDQAKHLMAYANDQGICIFGRPISIFWSKTPVPETIEIGGIDHSRAIILEFPPGKNKQHVITFLQHLGIKQEEVLQLEMGSISDSTLEAFILFSSYAIACKVYKNFNGLNKENNRALYARDPVETGVKTILNTAHYEEGKSRGSLEIVWKDWRIVKDKKAMGAYETSSESEYARGSSHKKKPSKRYSKSYGRSGRVSKS